MKMNKARKIIIPALSTAIGISLAAGIGGAFAWYQYNSQATASFVGSSVADTGVLQIGYETATGMHWGRDFYQGGADSKLVPVTFGQMRTLNPGLNNEKTLVLPDKAYAYPDANAGYKSGYEGWVEAEEGKHYAQFEVYLRALQADPESEGDEQNQINPGYKMVERDVFLSDYVLKSVDNTKVAGDALRVHIGLENGQNHLFSKTEIKDNPDTTDADEALKLYGPLDLDASGEDDTYHESVFEDRQIPAGKQAGETIIYGVEGHRQETEALSDYKVQRDSSTGKMPTSGQTNYDKKILTTSKTEAVKVTVTIWLEGWEYLTVDDQDNKSQMWNPEYTETGVQVGLQFDTGVFRGEDLTVEQNNNQGGDPGNDPTQGGNENP